MYGLDYDSSSLRAPEGIGYLDELAFDLRSTWEHGADDIWPRLDAEIREATHNPRVVLQTVAITRLREALAEPESL
jgi:starch phosphorylase